MAFVKHGDAGIVCVIDDEDKNIKCDKCGKTMKKDGNYYKCECGNETLELELNE